MSEETEEKKPLSLAGRSKLEMRRPAAAAGQVKQSFSHGRSKTVQVEIKRKRVGPPPGKLTFKEPEAPPPKPVAVERLVAPATELAERPATRAKPRMLLKALTDDEKAARARALEDSMRASAEARRRAVQDAARHAEEEVRAAAEREAATKREAEELERKRQEEESRQKAAEAAAERLGKTAGTGAVARPEEEEEESPRRKIGAKIEPRRPAPRRVDERRRSGRLTLTQALDDNERMRSLASVRRQREREKRQAAKEAGALLAPAKVFRDVVIPDTITVQELANRMTERAVDVIRSLVKMGMMATINQAIDAETAEIIVAEFGHRARRVSESDADAGFMREPDDPQRMRSRPPVVTVMGHVDHGKTSLLDALRQTDVAAGEAGGITQHIGAYQVTMKSGGRITFLDTPGHEAFTAMRARGARVTDIVILVVAADDGVMPQTVEAIRHARAAKVPIIVAVNKVDKPDANPTKIRRDLLQHEIVVEELGGDVLAVDVSAKAKTGLERLEEAILLQAEVLELKADPERAAEGVVIEAKLDRGRGSVATVLVQRGSLYVGDIVVAGSEWGRVRALVNDRGQSIESVGPGEPVEVLGLNDTPLAGDDFGVVPSEARAREVSAFRTGRSRAKDVASVLGARGSLDQMFLKIKEGTANELPIVVKTDVRGSLEAIQGALEKISTDEVKVRVLHGAVGGINESDVTLAHASSALIIGFNVRANAQARERAKRDSVDIRYYSIIYNVVDDIKEMLSKKLAPTLKEKIVGQARIKQVFAISKVGKIAGCEVIDGVIRRTAHVRLLRDDIVLHQGDIISLKHFKDDVREVRAGSECGIGLEGFQDVQQGDVIEVYEVESIARRL
ncbi:MAG: translation initiation factor IF-2 [Alphaproteobacteria bacterium]|nr:translation initiation factor IF-2 [Alphaproteobacteria bacterium]